MPIVRQYYPPRPPKSYAFTLDDIAAIVGRSKRTVERARRAGEFNPRNVESVIRWCMKRLMSLGQVLDSDTTERNWSDND